MKKNKIIKIGNEDFTIKSKPIDIATATHREIQLKDLYECYTRPSTAKEEIYRHYRNLLNGDEKVKVYAYGVETYNGFFINLGAYITIDGEDYYTYITSTKNWLYKVI